MIIHKGCFIMGDSSVVVHHGCLIMHLLGIENDSSPRDPKQGERGKIDKFNKIRPIFGFFAKMELGASR